MCQSNGYLLERDSPLPNIFPKLPKELFTPICNLYVIIVISCQLSEKVSLIDNPRLFRSSQMIGLIVSLLFLIIGHNSMCRHEFLVHSSFT